MSDHDQLTDIVELQELRASVDAIAIPHRPPLEEITGRGRVRRRHRRSRVTGLAGAGIVAVAAVTLGLTGVFGSASTVSTVRTASFTLVSYTDGTSKLTLNPAELLNPTELQSDFAKHGIPAKVTPGRYCTSDPAPAGFSQAVTGPGPGTWQKGAVRRPTITIDPSKIPAGTELTVGDFNLPTGEQQANFSLMNSSSYSCTSTPPDMSKPDTSDEDLGLLYGDPRPAGS